MNRQTLIIGAIEPKSAKPVKKRFGYFYCVYYLFFGGCFMFVVVSFFFGGGDPSMYIIKH